MLIRQIKNAFAVLVFVFFLVSLTAMAVSATNSKDIDEILNAHNKYRTEVNVLPLIWDNQLATSAQNWANHLIAINKLEHSGPGENIYWGGGSWTNAIDYWASEKRCFQNGVFPDTYNHNGQCNDNNLGCIKYQDWNCTGHYSQVVWSATKKVGCGKSGNYWVCQYDPAGNIRNYRVYQSRFPRERLCYNRGYRLGYDDGLTACKNHQSYDEETALKNRFSRDCREFRLKFRTGFLVGYRHGWESAGCLA
ncbi:MAG: CAP domain-containing protein [Methanosarcina vacuolata]|jgi:hypothetical protein|nr:CAP domain-containing protein [Methanosarcina vacuolata]